MKELGIKIISDDSGYELENRLSEPSVKTYNAGESVHSLRRCKTDIKSTDEIIVCNSDNINVDLKQIFLLLVTQITEHVMSAIQFMIDWTKLNGHYRISL